jgi:hypothetical protein
MPLRRNISMRLGFIRIVGHGRLKMQIAPGTQNGHNQWIATSNVLSTMRKDE